MVDGGHDLESALKRAARDHGINLARTRPATAELQTAIREYRELFRPEQSLQLHQQRQLTLQVMQTFAEFQPRLIGSLVNGDGPLDVIRLLLFADTTEQVILDLNDRHIPWHDSEMLLHYSGGRKVARPALSFLAGQTRVELIVLDQQNRSDPPRDAITGRALQMLDAKALETLIDQGS